MGKKGRTNLQRQPSLQRSSLRFSSGGLSPRGFPTPHDKLPLPLSPKTVPRESLAPPVPEWTVTGTKVAIRKVLAKGVHRLRPLPLKLRPAELTQLFGCAPSPLPARTELLASRAVLGGGVRGHLGSLLDSTRSPTVSLTDRALAPLSELRVETVSVSCAAEYQEVFCHIEQQFF